MSDRLVEVEGTMLSKEIQVQEKRVEMSRKASQIDKQRSFKGITAMAESQMTAVLSPAKAREKIAERMLSTPSQEAVEAEFQNILMKQETEIIKRFTEAQKIDQGSEKEEMPSPVLNDQDRNRMIQTYSALDERYRTAISREDEKFRVLYKAIEKMLESIS